MRTPQLQEAFERQHVLKIFHIASGRELTFPAFLTNFKDSYEQNWKESTVYGRNDPHGVFSNTSRRISVGITIPCESAEDSIINFRKLSELAKMQYPIYRTATGIENLAGTSNANTIQGAPFFKIKLFQWISNHGYGQAPDASAEDGGLLGRLGGFTFSPNLDVGTFHTSQIGLDIGSVDIFPKEWTLDLEFTPYHTEPLGWEIQQLTGNDDGKTGMIFRNSFDSDRGRNFPYSIYDLPQVRDDIYQNRRDDARERQRVRGAERQRNLEEIDELTRELREETGNLIQRSREKDLLREDVVQSRRDRITE